MKFTFQVWWRTGGKSYAETHGEDTLGDCQRLWVKWSEALDRWPDHVDTSGLLPILCPPEGPWPRDGEAGRKDVLVRAPERDPLEVAA